MSEFTHLDEDGEANMVDVGDKAVTDRVALARGYVYMNADTIRAILEGDVEKGEVPQIGRIAGIMGAKQTPDLIPLCHQLPLDSVSLDVEPVPEIDAVVLEAEVRCSAKTGAEMEALTAVSTAALTIYDMCKALDKSMSIGDIHLVRKTGGQSGDFEHPDPPGPSVDDAHSADN